MVAIGKAIMSKIMAHRCDDHAQAIQLTELQNALEFARGELILSELHNVTSVQVIMVLDIVIIHLVYFV